MLIKLLFCFIYFFTAYNAGQFIISLFKKSFANNALPGIFETTLVGTITLTGIALWVNLFMPANAWVAGILVLFFAGANFKNCFSRQNPLYQLPAILKSFSPFQIACCAFALVLFFGYVALPVLHGDSYIYHQQVIEAAHNYKAIPGIANLNERFAFSKGYFVLNALFSMYGYFRAPVIFLNGFLCTLFLLHCIKSIKTVNAALFMLYAVLGYFFFRFFISSYSSPSTDNIIAVGYLYLMLRYTKETEITKWTFFFTAMLAAFMFSVKASGLLILQIPLTVYSRQLFKKEYRKPLLQAAFIMLLLIVPCCIHTFISSGYIIYPFYKINSLMPGYSVPNAIARYEARNIAYMPQNGTFTYQPFYKWVPWWAGHYFYSMERVPTIFFALSFFSFVPWLIFKKKTNPYYNHFFRLWLAAYFATLVLYFNSPQYRFFLAPMLAHVALSCYPFFFFYRKRMNMFWLSLPFAAIFLNNFYGLIKLADKRYQQNFLVKPYPRFEQATKDSALKNAPFLFFNGEKFYKDDIFAGDDATYMYSGLKCVHYYLPGIQLRKKEFKDGFMNKNLNLYNSGNVPDSLLKDARLPSEFFKP